MKQNKITPDPAYRLVGQRSAEGPREDDLALFVDHLAGKAKVRHLHLVVVQQQIVDFDVSKVVVEFVKLKCSTQSCFSPIGFTALKSCYYPAALFPHETWLQIDVVFLLTAFIAALVLITLVGGAARFSFVAEYRYKLVTTSATTGGQCRLVVGGKKLPDAVSTAILYAHRRLHRWFYRAVFSMGLFGVAFCFLYGIIINAAFKLSSPGDSLFLIFLFPLHFFYICYSIFGISIFVVMTCTFLNIRQRHHLKRLQTIVGLLSGHNHHSGSTLLPVSALKQCWLQYLSINGYSALWTTSLTVYLGGFISIQCYLIYIAFFMQNASLVSRLIFFYGLAEAEWLQKNQRLKPYCMHLNKKVSTNYGFNSPLTEPQASWPCSPVALSVSVDLIN
ncbi:hypothetical protein TYRP_019448 [Tyrophagus putrescentiae]|nr:hypothetical protein TYRP_019448 [Tyrophagus putrescentiae]